MTSASHSEFSPADLPHAICLAGPTGSGKTALAIELAKRVPCEIINADSRQLYADFPIISAQPEDCEKENIPHHLYGFLASQQKCDAMSWTRMAAEKARQIWKKGKLPLLVGGTGFYFETFLNGLSPMPAIPPSISLALSARMEQYGPATLYNELETLDPEYRAIIHPNDRQRILRAHEVLAASGKTFSWWRRQPLQGRAARGALFVLNYPLIRLEPRLLRRIELMLEKGALDETAEALKQCPNVNSPGWSCIGAHECLMLLKSECSKKDAITNWHAATRAYAKRQITWFRHRANTLFMEPDQFIDKALRYLAGNPATSFLLQS